MIYDVIVVGGGAAGFFAALSAKAANPRAKVAILEKTAVWLAKVRVSGGGRCNVTHACLDPVALSKNYPRGEKELIGPFHRFQPKDTIAWFESRGVQLKVEPDGRMFPVTDSSETIIECLLAEAKRLDIEMFQRQRIETIEKIESGFILKGKESFQTKKLILASGSSSEGHAWARQMGHTIQDPVPSLFTFNVPDSPLKELSGVSFEKVKVSLKGSFLAQTGPFLITHFGFSGPAVLKLSAWAARFLHEQQYSFEVRIDWLPDLSLQETIDRLYNLKKSAPSRALLSENLFSLPKSFWKLFLERMGEIYLTRLSDIPLKKLDLLAERLHLDPYPVKGKTTHKEEFVTCGGVTLKEVSFKTMESKICPGLYFAGEVLDIDGVTGGFNFQNAWTTGFIAGSAAALSG